MSSIIDHVTLGVSDLETARHFYDRVMPTLGFQRLYHKPPFIGYGREGADDFAAPAIPELLLCGIRH